MAWAILSNQCFNKVSSRISQFRHSRASQTYPGCLLDLFWSLEYYPRRYLGRAPSGHRLESADAFPPQISDSLVFCCARLVSLNHGHLSKADPRTA